jgi:hypothetical protein
VYRCQTVVDPLLTVFSRHALAVDDESLPEVELAEVRRFMQQLLSESFDDGRIVDPQADLGSMGLSSMSWALIFAKLQQRFGKTIKPGLQVGTEPSVDSLSRLIVRSLHGAALPAVPPVRGRWAMRSCSR